MEHIEVQTGRPYRVHIGNQLLHQTGRLIKQLGASYQTVVIVSDTHVAPLYAGQVAASCRQYGFTPLLYTFPAGERAKSLENIIRMTSFLAEHTVTRRDLIIALGGGVTGDLAGFAAAIYQRGIDFIQIPTTLLAAIDSSVGGKTGVNIPEGKNLVGSFWQPRLVLCDISTFQTLPEGVFEEGLAEAIKYGCIWDTALFKQLEQTTEWDAATLITMIARCVQIKADIVEQDERESGLRQVLNFGHTLGHAIEKLSHFKIPHGHAVGIGMYLMALAGEQDGITAYGTAERIRLLLERYSLPYQTPYTKEQIIAASLGDKKRAGDTLHFITIPTIGNYAITPIPVAQIALFLDRVIV